MDTDQIVNLYGSNFWIIFAMSFQLKVIEMITFSPILNKTKGSNLELFIGELWLGKLLLNNSAWYLYLVLHLFRWCIAEIQGMFSLLRNDFESDQYVLVLVKGFISFFDICEWYFSLLVSFGDFNSFWRYSVLLNNLESLLIWR